MNFPDFAAPHRLFKIALIIANTTYEAFADCHDISKQLVSQVSFGTSKSKRVSAIMDTFIADNLVELLKFVKTNMPEIWERIEK
jgi:hypothetical protein